MSGEGFVNAKKCSGAFYKLHYCNFPLFSVSIKYIIHINKLGITFNCNGDKIRKSQQDKAIFRELIQLFM